MQARCTCSTPVCHLQARAVAAGTEGPDALPLPPGSVPLPLEQLAPYRLTAQQHQQLEAYLDYMLEINQSMNLTGAPYAPHRVCP